MRAWMLAFVAGCCIVQWLPALPSAAERWKALIGAVLVLVPMGLPWLMQRRFALADRGSAIVCGRLFLLLCLLGSGCLLGTAWAAWQGQWRLDDALANHNVDEVSRVLMRVAGLPQRIARGWRFEADVLSSIPSGVPERILVSWLVQGGSPGAAELSGEQLADMLPEPVPGEVWRAALVLRPPAGTRNPHLFDYEGLMFSRGIRALGTVRGTPVRVEGQAAGFSVGVAVERLRHHLRQRMQHDLTQARYGAVMIALALGDQAGVSPEDWRVFNGSGITHLVSISGSHVTLLAGMAAWLAMRAWRRGRWRGRGWAERWPAQQAGALVALLLAGAYCLLAGWGVPARRTFFMLAVTLGALMLRLPLSGSHVLALAAAAVVALDPWAVLSAGFWLSFAAVTVLMALVVVPAGRSDGQSWCLRAWHRLRPAAALQWAITLALLPALALMFQQLPLLSPLANALAIPVVGALVTPLVVMSAVLYPLPGLGWLATLGVTAAHALFEAMMWPIQIMGRQPWALLDVAAPPNGWLFLAGVGVWWALRPPGWPLRAAGWLLMLPALGWSPPRPAQGEWRISAMDVGQGTAILVETASGATLFDTGVRYGPQSDAGERIVWPYLRAQGWRRLEELVVSHADIDHAGGVRSVLSALPVAHAYASFDLHAFLRREARLGLGELAPRHYPGELSLCRDGQGWQRDGVRFRFVHPQAPVGKPWWRGVNADSCVLKVEGAYHGALLTGDIGAAQERQLLDRGEAGADWIAAAHHGSGSSSDAGFVLASGAQHAVAQMGAWNRYRHPHPAVALRWQQAGAVFWRSDRHGAVIAHSRASGLQVHAERQVSRRYWQYDPPAGMQ
ncbi:hypothetical protein AAV32_05240 [Kerstersia gyiorum]|uniref:Metallo-beta-lactamase domain-containing protein n=2 Tax=Kerstersia gyiorum TaxID=206506 RepID=A0A171KU97_9BURK|nr:hypothetical protein AAV32_05240 [Kerstersia gyiorum]